MPEPKPPTDDGLLFDEVGRWSHDKHHFLWRYIDAFTTAMKDKQWSGLHYIDLFAGSGIGKLKSTTNLEWGSPLLAAQAPHPFTRLHLCEKDSKKCDALRARLKKFPQLKPPQIVNGDANEAVDEIVKAIPDRTLSLAFLDPFGLHLHFDTVMKLSRHRCDLIIFFPDRLDIQRNWETYVAGRDSKLSKFMGSDDWRVELKDATKGTRVELLRKLYENQVKKLGYKHVGESERISANKRPLYLLLFFSKDKTATKIWKGIGIIQPDDQRRFDFGS
jgi:three-Cys-motif partner protein